MGFSSWVQAPPEARRCPILVNPHLHCSVRALGARPHLRTQALLLLLAELAELAELALALALTLAFALALALAIVPLVPA